jgi:hypothetical protein
MACIVPNSCGTQAPARRQGYLGMSPESLPLCIISTTPELCSRGAWLPAGPRDGGASPEKVEVPASISLISLIDRQKLGINLIAPRLLPEPELFLLLKLCREADARS